MRPRPSACTLARREPRHVLAGDRHLAGIGARTPEMTSASARWPLPDTPAMPRISPARTASDTSRSAVPECRDVEKRRASAPQHRAIDGPPCRRHDLVAAHQLRHCGRCRVGRVVDAAGDAAKPQHRAAMRQRPHLVELVRDEDDAEPCAAIERNAENSPSTTLGASTAVGSSRINSLARETAP